MPLSRSALAAVLAAAAAGTGRAADPPPPRPPEWLVKVADILFGDPMRGGSSPLAVSKSRYDWPWLARRHDLKPSATLPRDRFRGPADLFDRLDRDGDGVLAAADFDWSERSPFIQQQALADAVFGRLDADRDQAISAEEWEALFARAAGEKRTLTPDELRRALFAAPADRRSTTPPTRTGRLLGLLTGELGSVREGPDPGDAAPDFALRTPGGERTVKLSDYRGRKPVVLIFGSFT